MPCRSSRRRNAHVGTMNATSTASIARDCGVKVSKNATTCCASSTKSSNGGASGTGHAAEEDGGSLLSRHAWTIRGIDCPGCITRIETALHRLDGLTSAHITFATLRLVVDFDASRLSLSQIEAAVAGLGYELSGTSAVSYTHLTLPTKVNV